SGFEGASVRAGTKRNPIERIGGGGLTARIFLGLNVGDKPTYTIEEVVRDTVKIRKEQGTLPDASFLAQRGVYTQSADGKVIQENSVQIIIIDVEGKTKGDFTNEVNSLGAALREHFKQESVIVEIQERGIVQDVYSITA
ncbi:MAG TPA: hypothetical protein VMI75_13550, partial [Polyangiaceae bacterium]|nr:hypothetical protein [Polyangiaceae bacterium]